MTKREYNTSLSNEKKYNIFNKIDFSLAESVDDIVFILNVEKDLEFLNGTICSQLKGNKPFINNTNISPFLDLIDEVEVEKQDIIWELLLRKVDQSKNLLNKDLIINKIKQSNNSFTKAYAISSNRQPSSFFTKQDWKQNFSFKDEFLFYSFTAQNTSDLVNCCIDLLEKNNRLNTEIYVSLLSLLSELKGDFTENHSTKIKEFLANILEYWGFPENNVLIQCFSDFIKIEELLMTSIANYHDHIEHSLRVFLLGLIFILVDWELNKKIEVHDLVCWTFTAFFHDLGYGIQELQGLYSDIEKQYRSIGDITLSKFTFTESTRIFAEKIVNLMNELVIPTRFPYEGYKFMRLSPILKSLKEYKHGLISAILFLKSIDETIMKDYNFYLSFSDKWENIFLRSALAMSVHTYPPHLIRGLDIDLHLPKYKGRISYPLNPAFILCLFDSIEYLERPKFNRFDALPEKILVQDVKMNMKISFSYSTNHFVNLHITLRYTSEIDIIKEGKKIRDFFTGFNSSKWGVVITFIDKRDRRFKFSILQKELEDFLKFKESKQLQTINSYNDILRAYISFISSNAEVNGLDKKEVEYWKPKRVSFQILNYINQKEQFRSHFY